MLIFLFLVSKYSETEKQNIEDIKEILDAKLVIGYESLNPYYFSHVEAERLFIL